MTPSDQPAAGSEPDESAAATEDVRAKFRAALDKKHGASGAGSTSHTPGSSAVPASNDKRMRQFRRKSGG